MSLWSESEFQRVVLTTKLSERTRAACRQVLVDGAPGIDAASKNKMFPAQVSRAIGLLRDRQAEMVESAKALNEDGQLLKFTATQAAKSLMGDGFAFKDAQPGKTYDGQVLVITHGFVVQKVGRTGVLHDLGDLEKVPPLNVPLTISYPRTKGKASVSEKDLANEAAKDLGR